jgi:hypothetical protein
MTTKSQELRRLMQDNEFLLRLEQHIVTTGLDSRQGLDSAVRAVGISPRLILPELTSVFPGPQGSVLHIPLQISKSDGGRKSLFALRPGQATVAGIYIVGGKLFERQVLKRNGTDALRVGDAFTERITDTAGADVQTHAYKVSAIGVKTGAIYLEATTADDDIDTGDLVNTGHGWCWFCNMGSQWWCGFPCFPGDFGDIFV